MPVQMPVEADKELVKALLRPVSASVCDKAAVAAYKAQAEVAAAHPEIFAHLHLGAVLIETAVKTTTHKLSGGGHLFQRYVQLGDSSLSLPFELAARTSLQQRSLVTTPVACNKQTRKGQIIRKEPMFTLHRSNATELLPATLPASLAVITVSANVHKRDDKPLLRLVERVGGPVAAQLPYGPEGAYTLHCFYFATDADMRQLQIDLPVPVCSHGLSQPHAKAHGKNEVACCLIDAYNIHEMSAMKNPDGTWTEVKHNRFTQQMLIGANADDKPLADSGAAVPAGAAVPIGIAVPTNADVLADAAVPIGTTAAAAGDAAVTGVPSVSVSVLIDGSVTDRSDDDDKDEGIVIVPGPDVYQQPLVAHPPLSTSAISLRAMEDTQRSEAQTAETVTSSPSSDCRTEIVDMASQDPLLLLLSAGKQVRLAVIAKRKQPDLDRVATSGLAAEDHDNVTSFKRPRVTADLCSMRSVDAHKPGACS